MIVAIIVCYLPEAERLALLCSSISVEVDQLYLVDNSEDCSSSVTALKGIVNAEFVPMYKNIGLAAAQNIGINRALSAGADYFIFFDQDSRPPAGIVNKLKSRFEYARSGATALACVGARPFCIFDERESKPRIQKAHRVIGELSLVRQIISSSMMVSKQAFTQVGLFEEDLFIDGVDHEWCWRAASKGYEIAIDESVVMPHRLGDSRGRMFGYRYKVGSPIRLYYQFRNILLLCRRSYVPLYWKFSKLIALPARFILMSVFQAPRLSRLAFMISGIRDGLLERVGPYRLVKISNKSTRFNES